MDNGIKKETVKEAKEDVLDWIEFWDEESGGARYELLKDALEEEDIGPRTLNRTLASLLGEEKIYGKIDQGQTLYSLELPEEEKRLAFEKAGKRTDSERWERKAKISYPTEIHKNPKTKYDCQTYSLAPFLWWKHAQRSGEEIDKWFCDLKEKEEIIETSYRLKGADSETKEGERERKWRIVAGKDETTLEMNLVMKKPKDGDWSIHPCAAKPYMHKIYKGKGEAKGKKELVSRTRRGEELAEIAADMIREEEMEERDLDMVLGAYRGYFSEKEKISDFDYKNPITSEKYSNFVEELDNAIEGMKGIDEETGLPKTKREASKDTKTSYKRFKGPVLELIEYVENSTQRRLEAGLKR